MHACGHDTHTAIMMGVAEVLAKNKDQVAGTICLFFNLLKRVLLQEKRVARY